METLKYTVIKSRSQYDEYCRVLQELLASEGDETLNDKIDLLTVLIEKWDEDHNTFEDLDPIELLQYLMVEKNTKAKDLASILNVSKGLISDILNYKKGLSKDIIRSLSDYFKVLQEAFNRPYPLKTSSGLNFKEAM